MVHTAQVIRTKCKDQELHRQCTEELLSMQRPAAKAATRTKMAKANQREKQGARAWLAEAISRRIPIKAVRI